MRLDSLVPPFQRLREIVVGQFLGIQVASLVGEIVCAVVGAVVVLWVCNKLF